MADKIREVAGAEAVHIKNLTTDAAKSGAYIYPFHVRDDGNSPKSIMR
jgi:hypothetical protein